MNLYIDFGGTNFRYQLNNSKIKTLKSSKVDLKKFLDFMIQKNKIKNISISFAGHVNNGKIISSPNINIEPFNIKKYLLSNYGIKVKIDNDLNCAALAEYHKHKVKNMAVFYMGTGFGSAFINNGKIIKGSNNLSGELGHIPFKKTPFKCGCGRDDCLELSTSGIALIKWCGYYDISKENAKLQNLKNLDDKNAKLILNNFYNGLAHAFHTSLNLFDYELLILGGGLGKNKLLKKFLQKELKTSSFERKELKIELSCIDEGSLEGAKLL